MTKTKKLYWVQGEIGVDAVSRIDAMEIVEKILIDGAEINYSWLAHNAFMDSDSITLNESRKRKIIKK